MNSVDTVAVMTPIQNIQTLPLNSTLDEELLSQIASIGYSRIPLSQTAEEKTIIGIFLTKSLVGYLPVNETILQAFQNGKINIRPPVYFTPTTKLNSVAKAFKDGSSHMGVVCDERQTAIYLRD